MKRILHNGLSESLGGIEVFIKTLYDKIDGEKYIFDFLIDRNTTPIYYEYFKEQGSSFIL